MDPADAERVFERFYRADAVPHPGRRRHRPRAVDRRRAGRRARRLGRTSTPHPGKGAVVTVRLPRSGPADVSRRRRRRGRRGRRSSGPVTIREVTTNDSGTIPRRRAARRRRRPRRRALRELIETSVTTTVAAAEVRAAADAGARRSTERLAVARRPVDAAARARRPGDRPPRLQPGQRGRQRRSRRRCVIRRGRRRRRRPRRPSGVAYEGPPELRARRHERAAHGPAARRRPPPRPGVWGMTAHLELDYRGPLPLATPLRPARPGRRERRPQVGDHRHDRARRRRPTDASSRPAALFVTPRPEKLEAYFGGDHRRLRPARATP